MVTYEEVEQALKGSLEQLGFVSSSEKESSANEENIKDIERLIHNDLPLEYKAFLKLVNGGASKIYNLFAYNDSNHGNILTFSYFYGLFSQESMQNKDVRVVLEKTKKFVPSDLLPIAKVESNGKKESVLCVGHRDFVRDKVYLCHNSEAVELDLEESLGEILHEDVENLKKSQNPRLTSSICVAGNLILFFTGCYLVGNVCKQNT